jgi:Protein of unknown function (DUF4199)
MKTEIKWGLIFSLAALLWVLLERLAGLHDKYIQYHPLLSMLFVIPAVVMMLMAISEKRRELGGAITFKQAFLCGLGVSVVVTLLAPLAQYLTQNFITPNYFTNAINYAVQNGHQTREQAELYFSLKSYILQASLGGLVMGAITTLILAAIMRARTPHKS